MHHPTARIVHTTTFGKPVMDIGWNEKWLNEVKESNTKIYSKFVYKYKRIYSFNFEQASVANPCAYL